MICFTNRVVSVLTTTLVAACAVPGGTHGEVNVETQDIFAETYHNTPLVELYDSPAAWWKSLSDPVLDEMVMRLQAHNLDLEVARQNALASAANARSVGGGRALSLDVGIDASRGFVTPSTNADRVYSTNLQPNAQLAWQVDLFGKLKSQERSAWSDALSAEHNRVALAHTLIAALVRSRVQLSVLDRRTRLAESIRDSRSGTLKIVQGRYEGGVQGTAAVDVHQARENLAAAEATLPALALENAQTQHALAELLGATPGAQTWTGEGLAPMPRLQRPAMLAPAALLDRRPDLQAARARVEGTGALVDVALAARYPDLRLIANAGWTATDIADLFDTDRLFASLVGDLSVRLFGSGSIEADIDAAKARLRADVADYQAQILAALREVEDALVAENRLREQWERVQEQVREARLAESNARDRYSLGSGPLLTVLDTERRRAIAEDTLLRLEQSIWNARIDLHLALGGDWSPSDR